MPTYSYQCQKCETIRDVFHSMSATPRLTCEHCGSRRMKRLLGTGAGIIFKGSGFYETDYKNGSKKKSGESGGSESKSEGKSESKSETKSDTKSNSTKKSKESGSAA